MSGRVHFDYKWGCKECGGCTSDGCQGDCAQRWCSGAYAGRGCDRCPEKVEKAGVPGAKAGQVVLVRCNGAERHNGQHHWDPWKVGRDGG
jgi:hypothetical protein